MTQRRHLRQAVLALQLALLCIAAASVPAQGAVALKTRVDLAGPELRLSDLFTGLAPSVDQVVARAPAPGQTAQLDARWLYALARSHGIDWRPGSTYEHSVVRRQSQTLGRAEVETALLPALAEQGAPETMAILLDNPAIALHLPVDGSSDLLVASMAYNQAGGRFRAQLVAPADGQTPIKASVSGRVVRLAEVPVLRRRILPGDVITADDIEWQTRRSDRVPARAVVDLTQLVGLTPRRVLRAGEPVRSGSLRPPVLVAKNSLVTLQLTTDRMVLTAQGRALEDGGRDQVIRVVNTQSKVIVTGMVMGQGIVAVTRPYRRP